MTHTGRESTGERPLAIGEVCDGCAGFGVVVVRLRTRFGGWRTVGARCEVCAHVRPAQLKLNADRAREIARGLNELDWHDMNGEMLRPSSYNNVDGAGRVRWRPPACTHAAGWQEDRGQESVADAVRRVERGAARCDAW